MHKRSVLVAFAMLTSLYTISVPFSSDVRAATLYVGGGGPGNYTTIQSAVDNASSGDTVFVYGGTYYEHIVVGKMVNLTGEDVGMTTIYGGIKATSDMVNITSFTIRNSTWPSYAAIHLYSVRGCRISGNRIVDSNAAVFLEHSDDNVAMNNIVVRGYDSITLYSASNNFIGNNIISDSTIGISIRYSDNNSVTGNNISGVMPAIELGGSTNIALAANTMSGGGVYISGWILEQWNTHSVDSSNVVNGRSVRYLKNVANGVAPADAGQVILANCTNMTIANQNVSEVGIGIELGFSSHNLIVNNTAWSHGSLVSLYKSNNNTIRGNFVTNGSRGAFLEYSDDNTMVGNTFIGTWHAFEITESHRVLIDGNSVSGSRSSAVMLSDSIGPIVSGNNISDNTAGVFIQRSDFSHVEGNTALRNGDRGIYLIGCDNSLVTGNNASSNDGHGVMIWYSDFVTLQYNTMSSNTGHGVYLNGTAGLQVRKNIVSLNGDTGIYVRSSSSSDIYWNHILNNSRQAYDLDWNRWNLQYPSGGNFWSDYSGVDNFSGWNQDEPGSDGLGDTPYMIDINSQDRYPLMTPASDMSPPEIDFVLLNGRTTQTYLLSQAPPLVLTAVIDDTRTGGSAVEGAVYNLGPYSLLTNMRMIPSDGDFDSPSESAYANVPLPEEVGVYKYCVYGYDASMNINMTSTACALLVLVDVPSAPVILEALLTGPGLADVTLRWSRSGDDGAGANDVIRYHVYRSTSIDGPFIPIGDVPATGNEMYEWRCDGCGEGDPNSHFFYVVATDGYYWSESSNYASKLTRLLPTGPNLVSVPLVLSDYSIKTVLQTLKYDKAWLYDSSSGDWKWLMEAKGYGGLANLNRSAGLWLAVTEASRLTVAGLVPAQTIVQLRSGWNLISFPSFNSSYAVADLKAELPVERVEGFDPTAPPHFLRVLQDSDLLLAGEGYWVKVSAPVTWVVSNG